MATGTEKYVWVDMSCAYLRVRMCSEAKKVLYDDWLSDKRRMQSIVLYESVGLNFNSYIESLKNVKNPELLYELSVGALEIFRDNLDFIWMFAYSGNLRKMVMLPIITTMVY